MDNFKFFALRYLNHWCESDKKLVEGVSRNKDRTERLRSLREAAVFYGVAWNFKKLPERRFSHALKALDNMSRPKEGNVDSSVCGLADKFNRDYKIYAISAASKFLWLRFQSPVVMYDRNARRSLKAAPNDYPQYRNKWRCEFKRLEAQIKSACKELGRVKSFSLAYDMSEREFRSLVRAGWFHERVFDMFLWWNGNGQEARKPKVQTES